MKMSKWMFLVSAALMVSSTVGLVGCGDDDDNPANPNDSGIPDGSNPDGSNPDGGCKFNDFVINLINTQTTATAKPSTDLGDNCTDNHEAFPATLFQ